MLNQFAVLSLLLFPCADAENAKQVEAQVAKALAPLSGRTAFLFTELTPNGPKPLFGLRADERFAVGSSFKLYILGRLAEEVNDRRRLLENVMRLQADHLGPPSSEMAEWPMGSPVTVNTLAIKMISISDNTATDHLLYLLGRENVEKAMAKMGHHQPQWNLPLLSTREMVMLRDKADPQRLKTYLSLDEAGKRKYLADTVSKYHDFAKLDVSDDTYDRVEWFATAMDMARALNWLRLHTEENQPAHSLRGILAMKPLLKFDRKIWTYDGSKGGSEDFLIAGNWLLKNRNGKWYTFHIYWNSQEKVSTETIGKVGQAILEIVEEQLK